MSEPLAGVPPAPPPDAPRAAAVAILLDGPRLYWLQRQASQRFGGGFFAFPGGKQDADDAQVPGAQGPLGPSRACAVRELFEETGVLALAGAERLDEAAREALRRQLVEGRAAFSALCRSAGLRLEPGWLAEAGSWVTPESFPRRYDTAFFILDLPAGQTPRVATDEHVLGEWVTAREGLASWASGRALLHAPALHALRALDEAKGREALLARLRGRWDGDFEVRFQAGVQVVPLRTWTLPPATHTNCYLLGQEELLVVDPGASDESEQQRLLGALERRRREGARLLAIVLTHHHGDHTAGVEGLVKATGAPVWAHALTADRCPVPVARLLAEGEVLWLGGEPETAWEVLHTPGHARGHLCLVEHARHAAVVGDMVSSLSTIVIDPPEGDMAEYLRQLERLKALPVGTLYPAHGPPVPDGVAKLEEYLLHRAWREARVLEALGALGRPATTEELVPLAYDDVAAFVHPVAERNVAAILAKLAAEGRARGEAGRWTTVG